MKSRRRKAPENHERWLVSYADFITLLFAFFVVMFASSEMSRKKAAAFSQAYNQYLQQGASASDSNSDSTAPPSDNESADDAHELGPLKDQVEELLTELIRDKKIQVKLESRGLVISLKEAALFPPGEAALLDDAPELFGRLSAALSKSPDRQVRLEGHTDNVPIRSARYPSNWELSSARAIEVLRALVDGHGLDEGRIAVAGYGEHRPIAPNDTPDGRASNRRVDIVILAKGAEAQEPTSE